mgnify:CR=1 FL=1
MDITELRKAIRKTKSLKCKGERLMALRDLAEDLANDFTYAMADLESEIEFVLDRTPEKIKRETNYYSVSDVTQDISVTSSWEW